MNSKISPSFLSKRNNEKEFSIKGFGDFIGLFLLSVLILLNSCANAKNIHKLSHFRKVDNVPFYAQETFQCGPSSLAGVLNYWGVTVEPEEIAKEIFSSSARGTLNIDMAIYAQRKGLAATLYEGNIKDLKENIDSGIPVIVLVDYGYFLYQANHFMVVTGYNEQGVLVNSGKEQNKFIVEKDFLNIWKKANYITLLIKK